MTSHRLPLAALLSLLVACAGPKNAGGQHPVYPPSELTGPTAKCEKICDVQVLAATAEAFCPALVEKTRALLGDDVTCKPGTPLGLPTRDDAAVRDAMVVDLIVTKPDDARYSVLALRTEAGWELAAEVGAVRGAAVEQMDALTVVGARPVDAPELSPYAVEIRVRIQAQGEKTDRVYVCGKQGKTTACPRAIIAG